MKPNRRKFKTPEGEIIRTLFDAYWYAIDQNGMRFLYSKKPTNERFDSAWWPTYHSLCFLCGIQTGKFNWKACRWYLNDNGEWIRK